MIQKKTGVRLNLVREFTEFDLQQTLVVFAVVTAGFYQGGEFSFPLTNLSPEIELLLGRVVDLRFEEQVSTICQILNTNFDLWPAVIVATNCALSSGKTEAGEHLIIVKPDKGTVEVNFPEWQRKLSGETQAP